MNLLFQSANLLFQDMNLLFQVMILLFHLTNLKKQNWNQICLALLLFRRNSCLPIFKGKILFIENIGEIYRSFWIFLD